MRKNNSLRLLKSLPSLPYAVHLILLILSFNEVSYRVGKTGNIIGKL